jgi:hypothetical protein
MNTPDWSKWLCRCSSISKILANAQGNAPITEIQLKRLKELDEKPTRTEKQGIELTELIQKRENSKTIVLGEVAIGYLMEVYAWETVKKCSVSKELDVDFIRKGKMGEKEGLELLSYCENHFYEKNTERISNDFLSGEPDTFKGKSIMEAEVIPDIKIIWDYPGFLKKINKPADLDYRMQLAGYADISGASEAFVANCLIDTPEVIRNDYKRKLFYKGEYTSEESPDFLAAWAPLERSMIFKDIPVLQRFNKVPVPLFTANEQLAVYERVKYCREWLFNFDQKYKTLNT